MAQLSDEILNQIFGPELCQLTSCGAKELPLIPNYLNDAVMLHIYGIKLRNPALKNLSLAIVKNTNGAAAAYRSGRQSLLSYVTGLDQRKHLPDEYIYAVHQFEYCIDRLSRAVQCFDWSGHAALPKTYIRCKLFESGDGSILNRLSELNGIAKHFNAEQASQTSAPVWLTNSGLKSAKHEIKFDELIEVIGDLVKVNHDNFVAIPQEAQSRRVSASA